MGFGKKLNSTFSKSGKGLKSKKTRKGFNKFGKKIKTGGRKAFGGTKKTIGKIGNFAQKGVSKITAPLDNLTKSPMTLIIILGLGAFIVLKVMK